MFILSLNDGGFDEEGWLEWKPFLTEECQALYLYLRGRAALGDTRIDENHVCKKMRWSKAKLARTLRQLDTIGFVNVCDSNE